MDDEKPQVAIAGLLQVFAVVVGFFVLGVVMKFNGYPNEAFIRWNPLARGLREYGVWLLLIPVVWMLITLAIWNYAKIESAFEFAIGFGYLTAIVILILFLWAAMDSYRRPLFPMKWAASAVERSYSESHFVAAGGFDHAMIEA
jgi:hypothetical protein